jgi:hypothetical protein
MKFTNFFSVLIVLAALADSISAGGDNPCDLLMSTTNIMSQFQKFENIFKFLNKTASDQLDQTLTEATFSIPKLITDTAGIVTQATSVFLQAGLTIPLDSVTSAAATFVTSIPMLFTLKDQKTAEVNFIVNQGLSFVGKIETAVYESIAKTINVPVSAITSFVQDPSIQVPYPVSCIGSYLEYFNGVKNKFTTDLNGYANFVKNLIPTKFPVIPGFGKK